MMKSKDQMLLEEAYQRIFNTYILNEKQFPGAAEQFARAYEDKIRGDYTEFVIWLKEYSDDPRIKDIITTGLEDGDTEDDKLQAQPIDSIAVSKLLPTQKEIGIEQSLTWTLKQPDKFANYFKSPVPELGPIIVLNSKYVLDGHHRWSQVFCYNPEATISVTSYNNERFGSVDGLKAIQAGIAALKEPSSELKTKPNTDPNLLNCADEEIIKVLNPSDEVLAVAVELKFCEGTDRNSQLESFRQKVLKNVKRFRDIVKGQWENNPKRDVMPQPGLNKVEDPDLASAINTGSIQMNPPYPPPKNKQEDEVKGSNTPRRSL